MNRPDYAQAGSGGGFTIATTKQEDGWVASIPAQPTIPPIKAPTEVQAIQAMTKVLHGMTGMPNVHG